jgi:CheY-like chemotaxis protein
MLLVEDDENDIILMQLALEKIGVNCALHVARDGREALNYVTGTGKFSDRQKHPIPYLALLDLKLPYVMGLELLKRIRERPEFDSTVVIVLTSSNDPRDVETAYRLRANAYLVKPAGLDALEALTRSVKGFWFRLNRRSSGLGEMSSLRSFRRQ